MFSFTFILHEQTKKKRMQTAIWPCHITCTVFFIFNSLKLYGILKSNQDSLKNNGNDITCIDICYKHVQQSMQNSIVWNAHSGHYLLTLQRHLESGSKTEQPVSQIHKEYCGFYFNWKWKSKKINRKKWSTWLMSAPVPTSPVMMMLRGRISALVILVHVTTLRWFPKTNKWPRADRRYLDDLFLWAWCNLQRPLSEIRNMDCWLDDELLKRAWFRGTVHRTCWGWCLLNACWIYLSQWGLNTK